MRVLCFVNQKGGCGKTTTAINLAGALARSGRSVLLVDLDPQAHATLGLGVCAEDEASLIDVLSDGLPLESAIRSTPAGVDLVPATLALAEFEEISARMLYPERALEAALRECTREYDYVLLDCPPRADGVLTANALRAAELALLVVECGAFALQGAVQAGRLLLRQARDRGDVANLHYVATLFDRRTRFSKELLIAMQARFGPTLFNTPIRTSVRLREAAARGIPIQLFEPNGGPAMDFASLAEEVEQHAWSSGSASRSVGPAAAPLMDA